MSFKTKRVYDPPAPDDGTRVLVDRLWPRGISKDKASLDLWLKEIAPSKELREEFHHDPQKWDEFWREYVDEIKGYSEEVKKLRDLGDQGAVTLLFAAKDPFYNNATVLKSYLEGTVTPPARQEP